MRRRHREPGSLLAFLDVMACGLGAAILLFLIVRHNEGQSAEPEPVQASVAGATERLAELEAEAAALEPEIEELKGQVAEARERQPREEPARPAGASSAQLADLERKIAREKARNVQLAKEVESIDPKQSDDPVSDPNLGEENYLIGLEVEGRNIALLVDRSASMTDEKPIDVLKRKGGSDSEKKAGPKWQRTVRTARWLLNRLPEGSKAAIVVYGDKAETLGKGWFDAKDKSAIKGMFRDLDKLVPTGATNLEAGVEAVEALEPRATNVYLVTDGMPTLGSGGGRCNTGALVSSDCRYEHLRAAWSKWPRSGVKINVVLLPLRGDHLAADSYWQLTIASGGQLLSPAPNWP